jgi:hypothetical protein
MVEQGTSVAQLRNQIAFIAHEVAAFEAEYTRAVQANTKLQEAQSARDQQVATENRHKVRVTLKNGKTVYCSANTHALLPNTAAPVTIEFRMLDKAKGTYRAVGHAMCADVSEVHDPEG